MLKRIMIYLKEMFPPASMLGSFLTTITIQILMLKLNNYKNIYIYHLFFTSLNVVFFALVIRVMDEFKDLQDDLINYPNRPLPSGRVQKKDLLILGIFATIFPLLSSFIISIESGLAALAVLFYSFLMLKWFWMENKIRNSLPLALLTHHPIVFLHFIYIAVTIYSTNSLTNFCTIAPLSTFMLLFTNWEISRKIRYPADETKYTTYSKIWGMKPALTICTLLLLAVLITSIYLFNKFQTNIWFMGIFVWGYVLLMFAWIRPLYNKTTKKPFKFYSENMILFVFVMLLICGIFF